jgi:signal transduction histidine kinase
LELFDSSGDAESRKVANREPAHASMAERLERWPLDGLPRLGSSVFETKERLLFDEVPQHYLEAIARGDEQRAILRELAPRCMLSLPLLAHGQVLGSLTMIRTGAAQPFTPRDVALADGLAWRAALALDNARLYRAAQHALRMRDDVLSMVAHDLRNPLNAMLLQLHLLRRRGDQPERRSQEPVDAILLEGARLNLLIGDLLDVACIEAGTFTVSRGSLSVTVLAAEAVAASRLLAEEASLSLVLDESSDTELCGDRSRLLQALGNLIGNAIKFTPPGGTITLTTAADPGEVRISVIDTGPGIPAEQLPHLFDRFWQAKSGDRRGAGLGLWIAKTIVEAHDGQIQVESGVGRGSTFMLLLPRGPTPTQNLR